MPGQTAMVDVKKAVIQNQDMEEEMAVVAIETAADAMTKFSSEKEMASCVTTRSPRPMPRTLS